MSIIKRKYIVATRPSQLAFTQTEQTVRHIKEKNPEAEFEIVKFSTQGDKVTDKSLLSFGGTGVFVKELENALMEHRADFAVHSLKDVPAFTPESLYLASFPKREDPRDVMFLNWKPETGNRKLIIGTGSPRRIVQLAQLYPDAEFRDLRGNVDTRLRKLSDGMYDAIVLAAAGLKRLGKLIPDDCYLDTEKCLPAVSQGIIGIECRRDDEETIKLARSINDADSEIAVKAERGYMIEMEGDCKFPLAAYARVNGDSVVFDVMVGNPLSKQLIRMSDKAPASEAEGLGIALARKIKEEALKQGIINN